MRVIATQRGFFGQLIEPGQEFEVPDGTKGSWFKPVGKGEAGGEPAESTKAGKNSTTTKQVDAITKSTK